MVNMKIAHYHICFFPISFIKTLFRNRTLRISSHKNIKKQHPGIRLVRRSCKITALTQPLLHQLSFSHFS